MLERKRNDTSEPIEVTACDSRGYPINLTGATNIRFKMRRAGSATNKVDASAQLSDAAGGVLSYTFQPSDVDTSGTYSCEFSYEFSGRRQTFPSGGSALRIVIVPDL